MKVTLNDELVKRILTGKITTPEQEELRQLLVTDFSENDDMHAFLENFWEKADEMRELPLTNSETQLRIIHSSFGISTIDKTTQPIIPVRRSFPWLKVAAVLIPLVLIGITGFLIFQKNHHQELSFETPAGMHIHKLMPDGTEIWLNSDSKLSYSSQFGKKMREVNLSGEAYFNVKPEKNLPFIVNASKIKIKVLGTSFNVSAYPSDTYIETTLETGKIEYSDGKNDHIFLKAGDQAIYSLKEEKLHIQQVEANQFGSWRNNQLIFRNAELSYVLKRLEHKYGVKFNFSDKEMLHLHFTATLQNESLEQVLNLLSESIDIQYNIKGNSITLTKSVK